jgi:plastocyanin
MRRGSAIVIVIMVVAALLIAIGGWWVINQRNRTQAPQSDGSTQSNSSSVDSGSNTGVVSDGKVSIADMSFSPSTITVKKGTTVTWTNNDSVTHNVTAGNNGFTSGNLVPGKQFNFTFDKAGTFSYTCTLHPSMKGTVTVTD